MSNIFNPFLTRSLGPKTLFLDYTLYMLKEGYLNFKQAVTTKKVFFATPSHSLFEAHMAC